MKNIEKIAIDSIVNDFSEVNEAQLSNLIILKSEADAAVLSFKNAASAINIAVQNAANPLIEDDISAEAKTYFETSIHEITKIPFKFKN